MIRASSFLTELLELFVIAHELGHVFLHQQNKNVGGKEEEFNADEWGYNIYKHLEKSYENDVPELIRKVLFYCAPHFLFYIFMQLEGAFKAQGIRLRDTHPKAEDRGTGILYTQSLQGDYSVENIKTYVPYFTRLF